MTEPRIIKGATVIGEVKPGSAFTRFRNLWVIAHPDEPMKYLDLTDTAAGIKTVLPVPLEVTRGS